MNRLSLAIILCCGACQVKTNTSREERRQRMEGVTLSQSMKGSPAWTLKSRLALLREDDQRALLSDPEMEFYREGKAVSHVTALSGEVNTESHDVRLSSNVVLNSYEDRSQMTTSVLTFSSSRQRIATASPIELKRPEGVLRGSGLDASPDLSEIRIFDQRSVFHEKR